MCNITDICNLMAHNIICLAARTQANPFTNQSSLILWSFQIELRQKIELNLAKDQLEPKYLTLLMESPEDTGFRKKP